MKKKHLKAQIVYLMNSFEFILLLKVENQEQFWTHFKRPIKSDDNTYIINKKHKKERKTKANIFHKCTLQKPTK